MLLFLCYGFVINSIISNIGVNILQIKFVETIKTRISCSIFFFPENSVVYEIILKNNGQPGRPQMRVGCMSVACCIPNGTNTH
jgi:hypothetical protein